MRALADRYTSPPKLLGHSFLFGSIWIPSNGPLRCAQAVCGARGARELQALAQAEWQRYERPSGRLCVDGDGTCAAFTRPRPRPTLPHRSVPFTVLRGRHHAYSLQAHTNDHKRKRAAVRKADHKRLDVITLAPMSMVALGVHGFGPDSRLRGARTARRARGRESKKCDGRSAASENRAQSPRPAGRDTSFITHETAPF